MQKKRTSSSNQGIFGVFKRYSICKDLPCNERGKLETKNLIKGRISTNLNWKPKFAKKIGAHETLSLVEPARQYSRPIETRQCLILTGRMAQICSITLIRADGRVWSDGWCLLNSGGHWHPH